MRVQSGALDARVSHYVKVKVPDGAGGNKTELQFVAPLWVRIEPGSPDERFKYDQVHATERLVLTTRRGHGVRETDVIEYEGEMFNVRGVPTTNRREIFSTLYCERGVGV